MSGLVGSSESRQESTTVVRTHISRTRKRSIGLASQYGSIPYIIYKSPIFPPKYADSALGKIAPGTGNLSPAKGQICSALTAIPVKLVL